MNEIQKEVLIGCSLGDISDDVNYSTKKARFQICHSVKSEEYVRHKYDIFKNYCNSEPKYRYSKYNNIYFNTTMYTEFYEFAQMFFNGNIRGVPQNIEELLTPRSLAYWFCDDGTSCYVAAKRVVNVKSFVRLCTDRYNEEDVLKLIKALQNKFEISSKIFSPPSRRGLKEIYIGLNDSQKFFDIIEPFIFPSFKYKIKRPYIKT